MARPRELDYTLCLVLHENGLNYVQIGKVMGKTPEACLYAVRVAKKERKVLAHA